MSRRRRNRHRGRRRNPSVREFTSEIPTALYAIAGGMGTRIIPEAVLPEQNKGITGYLLNAGTAVALAMIGGKFLPNPAAAAKGLFLGGVVMTVARVFEEQFGKKLVEFSASLGLGNDPSYSLSGYSPVDYVLPTSSVIPGGSRVIPAANGNGVAMSPALLA